MSETVHTAIALALISGVAMAVIGVIFASWRSGIMGTPDDVIANQHLYMQIYFLGMPFFMLYNYGAAILRAVGDTKASVDLSDYFWNVINAVLNMILVIFFHMAVAGVAIATVISQLISCILVLRCLYRSERSYQLRPSQNLTIKRLSEADFSGGFRRESRVRLLIFPMRCCSPRSIPLDR